MKRLIVSFFAAWALAGCANAPLAPNVKPVTDFNADRYLGGWYEIARIENRFEKGLTDVTANYSPREDGGITVLNRGYKAKSDTWETAQGKAYFVGARDTAHLKVSFFGPFYGPYIVFDLGENYDYAFVTDNDKDFLWLLARKPEISDTLRSKFMNDIQTMDFDTSDLIWVDQSRNISAR